MSVVAHVESKEPVIEARRHEVSRMVPCRSMRDNTWRTAFASSLVAALAGRALIFLLLRIHWGWQPPYHSAYLHVPDWYEPATHEYLVVHMPGYWAFLRLLQRVPLSLYIVAPIAQTGLQLLAIASVARAVADAVPSRFAHGRLALAAALGVDPWLCDTAIVMLPASVTATIFLMLIERTISACGQVLRERRPPSWMALVVATGVLVGFGAYFRADFATYAVLPPLAVALVAWLSGAERPRRLAVLAPAAVLASLSLVIALLVPHGLYLRMRSGSFVLTTYAGGSALWAGLGDGPNPWGVPDSDGSDELMQAFGAAHGHRWLASAASSAFFAKLFFAHVREQPSVFARIMILRLHRTALGWPPTSVSFVGGYDMPPEIRRLGAELARGEPWYRLVLSGEHGPWMLKQFGLRYLGTALLWVLPIAALWFVTHPRTSTPLLLLPLLAYEAGIGVFVLTHWSYRYSQEFYWLGWLSVYLMTAASARADRD